MCKYSNANTHASIYKHGTTATLTIKCFCYCSLVKPGDLSTKGRVRFRKTLMMHNGIIFIVEISAQSQSPLQSLCTLTFGHF